jgi:hypothetical protein
MAIGALVRVRNKKAALQIPPEQRIIRPILAQHLEKPNYGIPEAFQ